MPKTTITVSSDTLERFDWYRTTFNMTSDELLSHFMDKLGLSTVEEVRQFKQNFRTPVKVEAEST